jgi:hypothetical protein
MAQKTDKSLPAKIRRKAPPWLVKIVLSVAIVCTFFVLAGRILLYLTIEQLTELTNTKIETESIDYNLNGSILVENLTIRPYLSRTHHDAILRAKTVRANFDLISLLLFHPRLNKLVLNDFVFNAQYNLDTNQWNLAAVKIDTSGAGAAKMPTVLLQNGILQYTKAANGQIQPVAAVPIDARFGPADKSGKDYSFTITTAQRATFGKSSLTGLWTHGKLTIAGGISSADIPAFQRDWDIGALAAELLYERNNTYFFKLNIKDLTSAHQHAGETFALENLPYQGKFSLFPVMQRFFNRYQPKGRVDMEIDAWGHLQNLPQSTLRGKILCKDVSICDKHFPYTVDNLKGQIDVTEKSFFLNNLCGLHKDTQLCFNGWSDGFGANSRHHFRITSNNLVLDNDLYNALSLKLKKFWSAFYPSGIAKIDYQTSKYAENDKQTTLAVDLLYAKAQAKHFPYPLKNLSGKFFFENDCVTFTDVTSYVGEQKITLNGQVAAGEGEYPLYDIFVKAESIPFDAALTNALSPSQQNLYSRFGAAAPVCIENLTGRIWSDGDTQKTNYSLTLNTKQLELNDAFFKVLPAQLAQAFSETSPTGKIVLKADINNLNPESQPNCSVTVKCLGDSVRFAGFPSPFTGITGSVTIQNNTITLDRLIAYLADCPKPVSDVSPITIDGRMALSDLASPQLSDGDIVLAADSLKIKGKSLTNFKVNVSYLPDRQNWVVKNFIADCYGGKVLGKFLVKQDHASSQYLLHAGFDNVDLKSFLADAAPPQFDGNEPTSGIMSGSLSLCGKLGQPAPTFGRCRLLITDMKVGKLSPIARLLYVLKLDEPQDFAFNQMLIDSYIRGDKLFFEKIDLSGKAVAFNGSGVMDLTDNTVNLTLTARGDRIAAAEPGVLQSLADALGTGVVRLDVTGDLYDPAVETKPLPIINAALSLLGTKPPPN